MDLRPIPGDEPIHISPTHDFEPSAPSPDSIAASPMISARMSDCAEMPLESDDGGDACSLASRRSTFSNKMDLYDLTKDTEFQKKCPEIYRFVTNSKTKGDVPFGEDKIIEEIREMYRENRELKKSLRQQRKYNEKLTEENRQIKENWGRMYAQAEQEEEFISNTLLKRINQARNEKDIMAQRHEQELQACQQTMERRIDEYYKEREMLEKKLKEEYTKETSNLERIVRGLQQDLNSFRTMCDRLRSEKVDQENALEHEQELLFNTLGKQMDQLNGEKRTLQASLEKAYHLGFIDPELDPAVLHPPPLVFKEQLHNCNGEVMRLRVQLKRTEGQINELKEKDAIKDAKIRALEENHKNLKWYKDRYNKMRQMFATETPPPELISESVQPMVRDVNMGPPSVPPTPRSIDNSSDMDETASYPASVDMN